MCAAMNFSGVLCSSDEARLHYEWARRGIFINNLDGINSLFPGYAFVSVDVFALSN